MPLPPSVLPTQTVTVRGTEYTIRSLSRLDSLKFTDFERRHAEDEAEVFVVARAFDVTEDEATTWLSTVDPLTGDEVLEKILDFSCVREVVKRAIARQREDEAEPDPKG